MTNMEIESTEVRPARDEDKEALVALWDACGLTRPWNHAPSDIHFARSQPNSDVLVTARGGRIAAAAMVGHDGHRGWVYYVSADPALQGQGLGRLIMEAAETWLVERGIWKLQLMVRGGNEAAKGFYLSLGYEVEDVTFMSKRLQPMPHVIV